MEPDCIRNAFAVTCMWNLWLFVFAVCNKMTKYRAISPFLCMDMTYITCLLKEGFGFKDNTVLQVSKSDKYSGCGRQRNALYKKMHNKPYSVSEDLNVGLLNLHDSRWRTLFVALWFWRRCSSRSAQQLAKKVNNVETSWALGATFDYFRDLNIH